ncbi:hypothetical protein [Solirubrum puertoriconensis]|uniref:Terminase small subunit n=1 Tax=Solirubrum puertoriconensis TaxID=1751427 RepID=A0A9X0HNN3_SOLP1|nr:hypothetical protein [Solirubrum puertoriconensis]KUG09386.1 hypothetical protein ASU33_16795 [Solirubrum puertoriconensis]
MSNENTLPQPAEDRPLAAWRKPFLEALSQSPNISRAARVAGISREWARQCRKADPEFAAEWEEALEEGVDSLEEACWARAKGENISYQFTKDGKSIPHPVTGEPYCEPVFSDTLAVTLLKAHRPEKYKDRSAVDVNATIKAQPQYDLSILTDEELEWLERIQTKLEAHTNKA